MVLLSYVPLPCPSRFEVFEVDCLRGFVGLYGPLWSEFNAHCCRFRTKRG